MSICIFLPRTYSDLKSTTSSYTPYPTITVCSNCDKIFNICDAEEVATFYRYKCRQNDNLNEKEKKQLGIWRKLEAARFPTAYDYCRMIDEKMYTDKTSEFNIHINMLFDFNDRIRYNLNNSFLDEKDEKIWKENILRMIVLYDDILADKYKEIEIAINKYFPIIDRQRYHPRGFTVSELMLFYAELHRYLCKFDECMNIIKNIDVENDYPGIINIQNYNDIKNKYEMECNNSNNKVFLLMTGHSIQTILK